MPYSVTPVAVVRDADEPSELQVTHSGLFLNLAQCCHLDVLPSLLMPFRQIPKTVAAYEQNIIPPV